MYFTNGDYRAFESLMRSRPGNHYDSSVDGSYPECWSCCPRHFSISLPVNSSST